MRLTSVALLCAAFLPTLAAQQPQDPLLRWMDQIAQRQFQAREDSIAKIRTVADAERRKQSVRETLLSLIGDSSVSRTDCFRRSASATVRILAIESSRA